MSLKAFPTLMWLQASPSWCDSKHLYKVPGPLDLSHLVSPGIMKLQGDAASHSALLLQGTDFPSPSSRGRGGATTRLVRRTLRSWGCCKFRLTYWKPVLEWLQPKMARTQGDCWIKKKEIIMEKMSSLKQIQTSSFRRKSMFELMRGLKPRPHPCLNLSFLFTREQGGRMKLCYLTFQGTLFLVLLGNCFSVSWLHKEWVGSNSSGVIYFLWCLIGTNE